MVYRIAHHGVGIVVVSLVIAGMASAQSETNYSSAGSTVPKESSAASELRPGRWSGGSSLGFLGSTPDGVAFAMNGNAEHFVSQNVSIGPLVQLGLTNDMTLLGFSGQGKYYIDMPGTQGRGKLVTQGGIGFTHADFRQDDTSWLVPLGIGYDYTMGSGISLSAMGLVNFTNLHTGSGSGADVMPGFTFGVRF